MELQDWQGNCLLSSVSDPSFEAGMTWCRTTLRGMCLLVNIWGLTVTVYYRPHQVRALATKCPECGSGKVVNVIYGYMELSEDLKKKLDAGRTRLGGCCVSEDSHVWECNSCHHEWGKLEI